MISQPKICLIGDIIVDVSLKTFSSDTKMRLGGIVHAARCLWALNIPFAVRYFAPAYLDKQVITYLNSIGCVDIVKLGNIIGAPYVFLIQEVKEVGDQGYEFLLRDEVELEYNEEALEKIQTDEYSEYLLISGNYDLIKVINILKGRIHIDLANNFEDLTFFDTFEIKLSTAFISTSSNLFKNYYNDCFSSFAAKFEKFTERLILKENRGGSRGKDFLNKTLVSSASQTRAITHSVGVGDVYDAAFISSYLSYTLEESMAFSSWVASEYAITTFPDDFKRGVTRLLKNNISELVSMGGVILPWEERSKINIYVAAPDFDFVETSIIDNLVKSLEYHNFKPRRPIKENGQMEKNASKARKQELFNKDIVLLSECNLLIAVLLFNDPGTLIEIGLAAAKGIPTIVFDPFNQATNCMLTELPTLVSNDLDKIMAEVFIQSNNL